jgi:hypothetical protein
MFAQEVIKVLRQVPSLSHMPGKVIIAGLAIALFMLVFGFLLLLFLILSGKSEEKVVHGHTDPKTHKMIMDLHKSLIKEMKGTSKQNALMIRLTIYFIAVTVLGIIVSVVGGQTVLDFTRGIINSLMGVFKMTTLISK